MGMHPTVVSDISVESPTLTFLKKNIIQAVIRVLCDIFAVKNS